MSSISSLVFNFLVKEIVVTPSSNCPLLDKMSEEESIGGSPLATAYLQEGSINYYYELFITIVPPHLSFTTAPLLNMAAPSTISVSGYKRNTINI